MQVVAVTLDGMEKFIIIYLAIMNALGLCMMFADKQKAKNHSWRTPEKVLFMVSLLGGSLGTWAGMYLFRHKTKHWYFVVFMPIIFFVHLAILIFCMIKGLL